MLAGFAGPVLLGLGSGISIQAGFGSFGFSVLLDGLQLTFGLPLWFSQIMFTVIFYGIAWKWARIPLGTGTISSLLLIGPAISLGAGLTPETQLLVGNCIAFTCGLLLFAFGISLAAAAALGPDGVTALSLAAEKRLHCPVPRSNLLLNAAAIMAGTTLGGNFGPATLLGLLGTPLLIRLFLPTLRRLIHAPVDRHQARGVSRPATAEATFSSTFN